MLLSGTGGIKGSQLGFIEYYLWNDGKNHSCSILPYTLMGFRVPTTTMSGVTGSLGNAYEYRKCVGNVTFKSKRTSNQGVAVSVGLLGAWGMHMSMGIVQAQLHSRVREAITGLQLVLGFN